MGRGKAKAPQYEFGVKASIVTTNARISTGQFPIAPAGRQCAERTETAFGAIKP
jgi:hypothetical protein